MPNIPDFLDFASYFIEHILFANSNRQNPDRTYKDKFLS
jgi:hypothetical protein